jgi:PII-like signaling protein
MLRIYVGEGDQDGDAVLYQRILEAAWRHDLSSATAIRGMMGFGRSGEIHRKSFWRAKRNLPVIIQIVDQRDRLAAFLSGLESMKADCLITVQRLMVSLPPFPKKGKTAKLLSRASETRKSGIMG